MSLDELLKVMVQHGASDLYLTVGVPPVYRIDGETRAAGRQRLTEPLIEALLAELLTPRQREDFDRALELNLALARPDLGRFRVNVLRQRGCAAAVIRRIRADIQTLEQLGLPPAIAQIMAAKRGLVLVVGATGSGKSTSLAAMIDHWNRSYAGHIITIEDPVEFVHEHQRAVITQREVGVDTHSFAAALKSALRQAPDVILIGEVRDTETMDAAITFAETGHLCLGTLHANNANQAMERVLNFFPPERHAQILLQLSLNLRAIVSQRLVPTVDGKRAAAIEVLRNTPRVADLLKRGEVERLKTAMSEGGPDGMQTFDDALYALLRAGRITFDIALAHADSANDLRLKVQIDEMAAAGTQAAQHGDDDATAPPREFSFDLKE